MSICPKCCCGQASNMSSVVHITFQLVFSESGGFYAWFLQKDPHVCNIAARRMFVVCGPVTWLEGWMDRHLENCVGSRIFVWSINSLFPCGCIAGTDSTADRGVKINLFVCDGLVCVCGSTVPHRRLFCAWAYTCVCSCDYAWVQ